MIQETAEKKVIRNHLEGQVVQLAQELLKQDPSLPTSELGRVIETMEGGADLAAFLKSNPDFPPLIALASYEDQANRSLVHRAGTIGRITEEKNVVVLGTTSLDLLSSISDRAKLAFVGCDAPAEWKGRVGRIEEIWQLRSAVRCADVAIVDAHVSYRGIRIRRALIDLLDPPPRHLRIITFQRQTAFPEDAFLPEHIRNHIIETKGPDQ